MTRLALGLALVAAASAARAKSAPEAAAYLDEMERRGLIDKTAVTPKTLAEEVRRADDELVAGQPTAAAARLYAVVEAPRYRDFSDSDDFADAEYRLALALARGGGVSSARRYYLRALARGPNSPYYQAAMRGYVDVCLDEHVADECIADADKAQVADVREELAYLRGRAFYDHDRLDRAESELAGVTPKSRFYSSALYLRGVVRVKKLDYAGAKDAFCAIADTKEGDKLRFYIDGRYFALRDLARLGLGRVAHEEGRDDDAFYHYFLVPSDSKKLPDALFEAAWASLSRKDFDLGARLVEEFLRLYGDTPRAAEARLLLATLQVKTCRFAEAEKGFDRALAEYEPLGRAIDRAIADAATRRVLAERLLSGDAAGAGAAARLDTEGLIASMLDLDARFFRLHAIARGLRRESADVDHVEGAWRALGERLSRDKTQAVGGADAAGLLEKVNALGEMVARARRHAGDADKAALSQLEERRRALGERLERMTTIDLAGGDSGKTGLAALVRSDLAAAAALRGRAASLTWRLDAASSELVRQSLVDLRGRVDGMLRQARLGKIDAVIGQKRKLERQIEDLAAGRFPPEMFGKLHIEGLIKDDEEYWPPEGERWADEYENYK